jgi:hypothetical protein
VQRGSVRSGLVAALGLDLVGATGSLFVAEPGAAAAALPNPCTLAPVALVAPALGIAPSAVHAVAQSSQVDGITVRTCSFTHGSVHVTVKVAPGAYGSGGFGGVRGLVISHPAGIGGDSAYLQDSRTGDVFASVHFIKGPYWAGAYSNAHVPATGVFALGRHVYAHLA